MLGNPMEQGVDFFSVFLVKDMFWLLIGAFFSFPPLLPEPLSIDSCMVSRLKMRFFSLWDMRFPTFCIKFSKFPKFSKMSKNVKFGFLLSRWVQRYPFSGVLWGKMLTHLWSAHSCTVQLEQGHLIVLFILTSLRIPRIFTIFYIHKSGVF